VLTEELRGLRVLVVDDDAQQLHLCAEILGGRCKVDVASSPGEALKMLEAERFDVVLSDQCMPDMTGTQLLAAVRRLQPGTRRVLMSAFSEATAVLPAIDAGDVHRFVSKPIDAGRFFEGLVSSSSAEPIRCVVIDEDEARARAIAEELTTDGRLRPTISPSAEGVVADLVILVSPRSVREVEAAASAARGQNRDSVVMVALPPGEASDGPSYLAAGVDDVLWLPLRAEEARLRHEHWSSKRWKSHEAARVRTEAAYHSAFPEIVGESVAMQRVFHQIYRVATSDASALLIGETGTGKELMARALHALSHRREAPFLAVNLSAIPETLLESELFGHERGSFTGARASRQGRLEAVAGGTLFLDEIGDLRLDAQVKLLRVLEQRTFERVGSTVLRQADFRLVSATHRNLEELVAGGTFREDLCYRINVVHIDVPPLRERREDIGLLVEHFLAAFGEQYDVRGLSIGEQAMQALLHHDWPGNVRELKHIIERAVAMTPSGGAIDEDILWIRKPRVSFRREVDRLLEDGRGLREVLAHIEQTMLVETLERCGGNQVAAARKLKIPRQTLQNRLKKYGL
jgi:two-component system, NtrC family, response regulator PilR